MFWSGRLRRCRSAWDPYFHYFPLSSMTSSLSSCTAFPSIRRCFSSFVIIANCRHEKIIIIHLYVVAYNSYGYYPCSSVISAPQSGFMHPAWQAIWLPSLVAATVSHRTISRNVCSNFSATLLWKEFDRFGSVVGKHPQQQVPHPALDTDHFSTISLFWHRVIMACKLKFI